MKILISLLLLIFLSGCGGGEEPAPVQTETQQTLLDEQIKTMDKAKAVEDSLQQDAKRKHKAIEEAGA